MSNQGKKKAINDIESVKQLSLYLIKQAELLDKTPLETGIDRLDRIRFLILSITSNARSIDLLARSSYGNEAFVIARCMLERIITFFYLQSCGDEEFSNYQKYSMQKTYRKMENEIQLNDEKISFKFVGDFDLKNYPDLKEAVSQFTSEKSNRPITRWSSTSIIDKLKVIEKKFENTARILSMATIGIYDDASEALHATLYGCVFHMGAFQPGVEIKEWKDAQEHHRGGISMMYFVLSVLLGYITILIGDKIGNDDLKNDAKTINSELREYVGKIK